MTIEEALAALGPTAARVAHALQSRSIRGRRNHQYRCPVALYLQRVVHPDIIIGRYTAGFPYSTGVPPGVNLPIAVMNFIAAFDWSEFSYLEEV